VLPVEQEAALLKEDALLLLPALPLTAKVETFFLTLLLSHWGQVTF